MNHVVAATIMLFTAIAGGALGALWDSGVLRNPWHKFLVFQLAVLALVETAIHWTGLSPVIAHSWWDWSMGQSVIPKPSGISQLSLQDIYWGLLPAFALTVCACTVPAYASYFYSRSKIAKRQKRKSVDK